MRSFINAMFDKDAALARAATAEGAAYFADKLEQAEKIIQIPQVLGGMLLALMAVKDRSTLVRLFEAIPAGSDLTAIAPVFNHWAITTETRDVPADFQDVNALRGACILANERRLARMQPSMTPAQLTAFAGILATPGARQPVSTAEFEEHIATWKKKAKEIMDREKNFAPVRALILAYVGALWDAPEIIIGALARKNYGGDCSPGIADRLLNKTLTLFSDAPIPS